MMQLKKEMASQVPPGYELASETKPKTKSVKRNERKKEKRLQVSLAHLFALSFFLLVSLNTFLCLVAVYFFIYCSLFRSFVLSAHWSYAFITMLIAGENYD